MKISKYFLLTLVLIIVIGVTGCESTYKNSSGRYNTASVQDADLLAVSHKAAAALIGQVAGKISKDRPLIMASFADVNNLMRSSPFGRMTSQQLSTGFVASGYKVVEMLLRDSVYIKQGEGEFLLSRAVQNISQQHDAQAVVVGTYAVGKENVYVTAKLIRTTDNIVLGSYDYTLPLGPDTRSMLN